MKNLIQTTKQAISLRMNGRALAVLFGAILFNVSNVYAQNKVCNTGIDGDVKANTLTFGGSTGASGTDDWFPGGSSSDTGKHLIDTTKAAYYLSKFSTSPSPNTAFSKQGSTLLWATLNSKIYIAGGYARDHVGISGSSGLSDSTTFGSLGSIGSAKNGMNPRDWGGAVAPVQSKNDIIDVYTAFRRNGKVLDSSLWLLGGVAIAGNTGSRFFDFEYIQTKLRWSLDTQRFFNYGPDSGHTSWKFDATGHVTQVGDLILACEFDNTGLVSADVRLWTRYTDWTSTTPAGFKWGANFDGAKNPASANTFGYASVGTLPSSAKVSQINTSPVAGPPWGAKDASGAYSTNYITNGFLEFAINLTSIGIDPKTLPSFSNPCLPIFNSFLVKTRASASFGADLKDGISPIVFNVPGLDVVTAATDTLRCNKTSSILKATSTTSSYYTASNIQWNWSTTNGNIVGASNTQNITVNKKGTYVVSIAKYKGCTADAKDTAVVLLDKSFPVATINPTLDSIWRPGKPFVILVGGDSLKSVDSTSVGGFGPSKGINWNWLAPDNSTYTTKDVTANLAGVYVLSVSEKRNGCLDTAQSHIIELPLTVTYFRCEHASLGNTLFWGTGSESGLKGFEVYRSTNGKDFKLIQSIPAKGSMYASTDYNYVDNQPLDGVNYYKLRAVNYWNKTEGIMNCTNGFKTEGTFISDFKINPNPVGSQLIVQTNVSDQQDVTITVIGADGRTVSYGSRKVMAGNNSLIFPVNQLKAGYYTLSIQTPSGIRVLPFIRTASAGL